MKTYVEFKTKIKKFADDGAEYIIFKRKVRKTDTPLKPHEYSLYNSDLMDGIVQRQYNIAISGGVESPYGIDYGSTPKEWARLDKLPQGVTIVNRAFMATVRVEIELREVQK